MNQRELIRDFLTRPTISPAISLVVPMITTPGVVWIATLRWRLGYFAHLWWRCLRLRQGGWSRGWAHYLHGCSWRRGWLRSGLDWRGAHDWRRRRCCLWHGGRFALAEDRRLWSARHAAVDAWIVVEILALLSFLARHGRRWPAFFPYQLRCAWCRRGHYWWACHWRYCGHLPRPHQGWINLSWCGSFKPLRFAGVGTVVAWRYG